MKVIDNAASETLCGVDAHSKLEQENAELKAVLRDVLEGKGFTFTSSEVDDLQLARKLLEADGCWTCVGLDASPSYHHHHPPHHYHQPQDRALALRAFFSAPWVGSSAVNPIRVMLVRIFDAIIKAGT